MSAVRALDFPAVAARVVLGRALSAVVGLGRLLVAVPGGPAPVVLLGQDPVLEEGRDRVGDPLELLVALRLGCLETTGYMSPDERH